MAAPDGCAGWLRRMAAPGWRLHPLKGRLACHWAVWVDSHWRLAFAFEDGDVFLVDYQQYH